LPSNVAVAWFVISIPLLGQGNKEEKRNQGKLILSDCAFVPYSFFLNHHNKLGEKGK